MNVTREDAIEPHTEPTIAETQPDSNNKNSDSSSQIDLSSLPPKEEITDETSTQAREKEPADELSINIPLPKNNSDSGRDTVENIKLPTKQLWSEITDDEYEGDSELVRAKLAQRCLQRRNYSSGAMGGSSDDLSPNSSSRKNEFRSSNSNSRMYGWGSGSNDGGSPSSSGNCRNSSSPSVGGGNSHSRRRGGGGSSSGAFPAGSMARRGGHRRNKPQEDLEVWSRAATEDLKFTDGEKSPSRGSSTILSRSLTANSVIPPTMDRKARIGGLKSISALLVRAESENNMTQAPAEGRSTTAAQTIS